MYNVYTRRGPFILVKYIFFSLPLHALHNIIYVRAHIDENIVSSRDKHRPTRG